VNLIIGFPHETRRHILQTILECWRMALLGAQDVSTYIFSPYPGSALFEELKADGRIGRFDDAYFRSLIAFMNPFAWNEYCRNIGGRELAAWRLFAMLSFYAISYTLRPFRFARLVWNLIRNENATMLESRLGAIVHRPRCKKSAAPSAVPGAVESPAT
jgi:anaerobic magnesium-protoporphyrin IX monomethyl ester cyclase